MVPFIGDDAMIGSAQSGGAAEPSPTFDRTATGIEIHDDTGAFVQDATDLTIANGSVQFFTTFLLAGQYEAYVVFLSWPVR